MWKNVGDCMTLRVLRERFLIGRYEHIQPLPEKGLFFVSWVNGEFSVLAAQLPGKPQKVDGPWACLGVAGTMYFSLVGVMAELSGCLAEAGIPLLAQSTYDTDYLFVKEEKLEAAIAALLASGIHVEEQG